MAPRRNSHTNKFKLQAMKLNDDLGNVIKASTEHGIPVSNLMYWLSLQPVIVAASRENLEYLYQGRRSDLFPLKMFNDSPRLPPPPTLDHELLI